MKSIMLIIIFTLISVSFVNAGDGCSLIGEISVEAAKQAAWWKCFTTMDPVACSIASALESAAVDGIAKMGATAGCNWTVKISKSTIVFFAESTASLKKTYEALNTVRGIHWLSVYLGKQSLKCVDDNETNEYFCDEEELSNLQTKNIFFVCLEHPDFPLGKAFGPYDSTSHARYAIERHKRATGHQDIVLWGGESPNNIENESAMSETCFCVGDCVKDTGDSSHFRRVVDVDCNLSTQEQKRVLLLDMMTHYFEKHVFQSNDDPEIVLADMKKNIRIRCYHVNK